MRTLRRYSTLSMLLVVAGCATLAPAGSTDRSRGECAFRICIRAVPGSDGLVYRAHNQAAVPATVGIYFNRLENLVSHAPDTVVRVVPPGERWVLVRLAVEDPKKKIEIRPVVTIDLGSDALEHRPPAPYTFPFGGEEPRPLISGYGGPTHRAANHYSYDFGMPEGTPVLAARDGVVIWVQDGFRRGGLSADLIDRANLVAVGHDDGTIASYGHMREGLDVAVGDTVRTGQRLGWSGSTGFSGRPHLHFHVGKRLMGGEHRTIPVRFDTGVEGGTELVEGELYGPGEEWPGS